MEYGGLLYRSSSVLNTCVLLGTVVISVVCHPLVHCLFPTVLLSPYLFPSVAIAIPVSICRYRYTCFHLSLFVSLPSFITVPPSPCSLSQRISVSVELLYALRAVQVVSGFPCVIFTVVPSPSDKILRSPVAYSFLEDFLYLICLVHCDWLLFCFLVARRY